MSILLSASVSALAPTRVNAASNTATTAAELRRFALRAEAARLAFLVIEEPAAALLVASWLIPATHQLGLVACVPVVPTQPFHTARALSAMDILSHGRMGWMPQAGALAAATTATATATAAATLPAVAARSAEYVLAAQALWDSWDADALVIDKQSAVYLDSEKIRRVDFRGEYFQVMGPLNAARPAQGYPVRVQYEDDTALASMRSTADVLIIAATTVDETRARVVALRAEGAARIFVRVHCTSAPATRPALPAIGTPAQIADLLARWHAELACDGFELSTPSSLEDSAYLLELVTDELAHRGLAAPAPPAATTLRAVLRRPVPVNRYSTP